MNDTNLLDKQKMTQVTRIRLLEEEQDSHAELLVGRRPHWRQPVAGTERVGRDFSVTYASVLRAALAQSSNVDSDPEVLAGAPRVAGTRIPLYMVLDAVLYYGTLDGVLKSYSQLTLEQVKDAIAFAALLLEQPCE